MGSNATLAWVCHTQGNHTLDKVYWSLVLHSESSRLPLLALKRNLAGNIQITPMQDIGRVQWTGNASQGKLSFVIYDVRRSDELLYRIRLKLHIPEDDSLTAVHRKSYLRMKVAGNKREKLHVTLKYLSIVVIRSMFKEYISYPPNRLTSLLDIVAGFLDKTAASLD